MMQCMSKDFLFTTIPDVTDIGNSKDPPDLKRGGKVTKGKQGSTSKP